MARPTNITLCSFCGKSHAEVKKLIAGPGVYICDNCVILCKNVLDKELTPEPRKALAAAPHQVPKPADIKNHLDQYCVGQDQSDSEWFYTAHHELGHGYYFMSYARPEVPPLLRLGANAAFHEAMGELIALAASQVPYLESVGVLPPDYRYDRDAFLLNDALVPSVPFIFWASGTMTHWEADVYARELPPAEWNRRWWQYVRDFQGVEPPADRGEEFCDAATKTHINDTPCYYYSYAVATVLKFQLHDHIARKILKQPLQRCNYANQTAVGDFLRGIMRKGATEDWRKVLREATGEDLSTRAMVAYYQPLLQWLRKQNQGRPLGWE